jgi:hypothetical protein
MVPCTVGYLKGKYELWINEEGQSEDEFNEKATETKYLVESASMLGVFKCTVLTFCNNHTLNNKYKKKG